MSKLIASGTLEDASDYVDISLEGDFCGAFGLLLYGTFGTGPGEIEPRLGVKNSLYPIILLDPADMSRSTLVYSAAGLYYFEGFGESIRLDMSSGENGVTAINYKLYIKPRP